MLHPIVAPSIIYYIILFHADLRFFNLNKQHFLLLIFGTSFILLSFFLILFRKLDWIASLQMHERKERRKPLIFTLVFLLCLSYYIKLSYPNHPILSIVILMISFSTFLILIITEFWKISVHAAGIGGVMGVLYYLYLYKDTISLFLLFLFLFISTLLLLSRLILNAHNHLQLLAGFFLSFSLSFYTSMIFIDC